MSGRTIAGRYLLRDQVGRGGFGVVYGGVDLTAGGEVAVKIFSRSEGFAPRAAREARTASKLDHPCIHQVLGVEQDDDHAYLISRLVVGKRLDKSELSDEEAVRAIAAVCDALAHAHSRNVIHRDVKPSNILVADDGSVVLTDFGIARDRDALDQTMDEKVLGTLSYMAPEQARGEGATGKTDVWAAALTLYEALTGINPFRTKSLSDLLDRLSKGAPPLAHSRPDLPPALGKTLRSALDENPDRRPSATELRDRLIAALRPDPQPEQRPLATLPAPAKAGQLGAAAVTAAGGAWLLTAFPVYPPSWTVPLALVLGLIAWRSPFAALCAGALLGLPAVWNFGEAGAMIYAVLAVAWLRAARPWGARAALPLIAAPLGMLGLGPAYVLIAAGAPTARRRLAEGAAGGLVAVVAGTLLPGPVRAPLAGADNPVAYVTALGQAPGVVVIWAAVAVFAPLMALALAQEPGRRGQALALWALAFALVTVALPHAIAEQPGSLVPAAGAAMLVAILACVKALAGPRLAFGG